MNQDDGIIRRKHFTLIKGGAQGSVPSPLVGPVTRLGLWNRRETVSTRVLGFLIFSKLAVLAAAGYYFFG